MNPPVPRRRRILSASIARAAIALTAVALAAWLEWGAGATLYFGNEWLRDHMVRLQASDAPETRLTVIDIDEASLAEAGPWPWPRERLATLIEQLLGPYGARAVGLDLVLPEPADRGGDRRLAMLAEFGPLLLPHAFDYGGALGLRVGKMAAGERAEAPGSAVPASGFIANHAGLERAARIGNIGFIPDPDGMIRRLPMQTWFGGRRYPTLALGLTECCAAAAAAGAGAGPSGGMAEGGGLRRLPFSRQWQAYTVIPAALVLAQQAPAELIEGKLVLIGSTALGLADRVATPLSPSTGGLMVHAAALTALLDARDGSAPAPWPGRAVATLYALLVTLLAGYSFPRLSAALNALMLAAASTLWLALAYLMLPHDALFSTTAPLATNLFLLAAGVPFAWQMTQSQSRKLLGTLRQYVADSVVDELLRTNLTDPLAPARRDVTTLIADMEGYTSHVAALPVEAAAQLTRDFLDCLTRPVLACGGTLDKYTGDGLVAFWGAPLPAADHADRALDAAHAIMDEMARFNAARAGRRLAPVRVRIGIESGVAMAGDFGSSARSIYTAVGDSVNVASRLETAARERVQDVIIGPGTASRARRHQLLPIGRTVLRGKDHATELYTLGPVDALDAGPDRERAA